MFGDFLLGVETEFLRPSLAVALLAVSLGELLVGLAVALDRVAGSVGRSARGAGAARAVLVELVADGAVAAVDVGRVVAPLLLLQPVQLRRPTLTREENKFNKFVTKL